MSFKQMQPLIQVIVRALVNTSGQLIGLNSLKIADDGVEGLGFAIPSKTIVPIIDEIMEKGKVVRPYIGVGLSRSYTNVFAKST